MASAEKPLTAEQKQAELEKQYELEKKFGADITAIINKAMVDNIPYPAVVYQLDEIVFDLKYKYRKMADMRTAMALQRQIVAGKPSDIPPRRGK